MPPITADTELDKALDKIEASLDTTAESAETGADLAKALLASTEATKGAIDLAKSKGKSKRNAKAKAKAEVLAKARDHEDDEDDDEDDEDERDKHRFMKKHHIEKAIDWEALAADIPEASKTAKIAKSISVGDMDVFNMDDYLAAQLKMQEEMAKSLDRANKQLRQFAELSKGMLEALSILEDRLLELGDQSDRQERTSTVMAKAIAHMLTQREAVLDTPATSKYAAMEKSVAQVQRAMDSQGFTVFEPTKPNIERLAKAVMTGKITQDDAVTIKRTQRLPPGVSLN